MRTTDKEQAIISYLCSRPLSKVTFELDELADYIYIDAQLEQPTHWRSALTATIRNLGSKVERSGCRLRRVSELGRGNKAKYEFKGDFRQFKKESAHAA